MADYTNAIRKAARKYGMRPELLLAQLKQESGLNPNAKSPAGATGIAQFMPATAKSRGVNPNDPISSIKGAAHLMSDLIHQYGGNEKKALAAYNAGPGAVNKAGGVPNFPETQNYVKTILGSAGKGMGPKGIGPGPAGKPGQLVSSKRGAPRVTKTSVTTPAVDNSAVRSQLVSAYMKNRSRPGAMMSMVAGVKDAQDAPASTTTTTTTAPGAPTTAAPPAASPGLTGGPQQKVVEIGRMAQQMGLHVGEQSQFGGKPSSGHVENSNHYSDRAIDVSGDPKKLSEFNELIAKRYGSHLNEMFYDKGKSFKHGKPIGSIGGHDDHVHVAM